MADSSSEDEKPLLARESEVKKEERPAAAPKHVVDADSSSDDDTPLLTRKAKPAVKKGARRAPWGPQRSPG